MWELIRWFHLIAMAFFVGGQIVLAAAVVPAFRGVEGPERDRLRAIARTFGYGTLVAIGVLVATGAAMASHFQLWSEGTLQLKLALVVLVGALVGWHILSPRNHALDGLIFVGSLAIVWFGVALSH